MLSKSEIFNAAHVSANCCMVEQKEIKHPSAHKTYQQLFATALRGCYVLENQKSYVPVEKPKFMWLRGM